MREAGSRRPMRSAKSSTADLTGQLSNPSLPSAKVSGDLESPLTRTADPLLTIEDSSCGYAAQEGRLRARFPCSSAGSSSRRTVPRTALSLPEEPRTCPQDLSPLEVSRTVLFGNESWPGGVRRATRLLSERAVEAFPARRVRVMESDRKRGCGSDVQRRNGAGRGWRFW